MDCMDEETESVGKVEIGLFWELQSPVLNIFQKYECC